MAVRQIWFGTRAVDFTGSVSGTGSQLDLLDDLGDFGTKTLPGGGLYDFAGIEWQQVLAFVGTLAEQAALGIDLTDGVDVPTPGSVNTTGDLLVGSGVEAHNIADSSGGTRLANHSGIDRSNDPVSVSGHGKLNAGSLTDHVTRVSDGWVTFSNDKGFGFVNSSGAEHVTTATRINDGDSVTFDVAAGSILTFASFTVRVAGGGSAHVVIDSDGKTIADTNGTAVGGFVQDASSGELDLGALADGDTVEIDFSAGTIAVNGSGVGVGGFFAGFILNGGDVLTLGSKVGAGDAWSADDLVLTVDDDPSPAPGAGFLSLDWFSTADGDPAPGSLLEKHLYAYFDADEDNAADLAEAADAEDFGLTREGYEAYDDENGDGDDNPLGGSPASTDWLDMYALGWANTDAASGHQYGEHIAGNRTTGAGRFGLSVNTARDSADVTGGGPAGSPADIETGTFTYSDGPAYYVDRGEVLGFVLRTAGGGLSAKVTYGDASDLTPGTAVDITVRLYAAGTLIETIDHDILATDDSFTVADDLGAAFDRIEIQAAGSMDGIVVADAGARFVLADLDIVLG
jgi:hypothetical protein